MLDRVPDANRLHLYYSYATVHWRGERYEVALEYLERARDELRTSKHSPAIEAKLYQMAGLLESHKGRLQPAVEQLEKALRIERDVYGAKHPFVATVHNNLAAIQVDAADLPAAERHLLEAVAIWDGAGKDYASLSGSAYNNLGVVQARRGRYEEAEVSYRKAIERMLEVLAQDDVALAMPRGNIADVLKVRGRYEESEALRRNVIDELQDGLGPEDSHTLITRRGLGELLVLMGETQEGLGILEDVAKVRERRTKHEDPTYLVRALESWGTSLMRSGDQERAIVVLRRAQQLQQSLGEHPRLARVYGGLAAALARAGQLEEAARMADEFATRVDALAWDRATEYSLEVAAAWQFAGRDREATMVLDRAEAFLPDEPIADHWRHEWTALHPAHRSSPLRD
jgi:tetratricopeptide (TPR) repeat protein